MKTDNIMIPTPLYSLQELKVRMIVVGWSLLATYILFVIFFTPAHVEAWKKYAKKCVNLRQNSVCLHWKVCAIWKVVFGIFNQQTSQIIRKCFGKTSLNAVPLAFPV